MLLRIERKWRSGSLRLLAAMLVLLLTAACAGEPAPPLTSTATTGLATPTAATSGGDVPAAAEPMVQLTRADLTKRLGVPDADIMMLGMVEEEWPDSSLGCPKEGMNYLQVITPGYLIRYEVAAVSYEYHTDTKENFVLCDKPSL